MRRCRRRYGDLGAAGELTGLNRADATSFATMTRPPNELGLVLNSKSFATDLHWLAEILPSSIVAGREAADMMNRCRTVTRS
jgi:hypothetical protein